MMALLRRYRGGAFAVALLVGVSIRLSAVRFDTQELGIASNTVTVSDAAIDGHPARDNKRPIEEVIRGLPTRADGAQPVVWIGNSHQHALNDRQPGDTVSSVYLHRLFNGEHWPGRVPVFGISYPNLTYQEQFLLTLALAVLPDDRRPRVIVSGVRFHDAREMGVRAELRPLLKDASIAQWLSDPSWAVDHKAAFDWMRDSIRTADEQAAAEEGMEPSLVRTVGPFIPIFNRREFVYAHVIQGVHDERDRLFGITTRTKRAILEPRYEIAMQYLDLAAIVAKQHGIAMLLYNDPLRQEMDNPYVPEQYARFRRDLVTIGERRGILVRDYDSLIPRELWGTWYNTDLPDFSHFTAAGHRILAKQVYDDILPLFDSQHASTQGD